MLDSRIPLSVLSWQGGAQSPVQGMQQALSLKALVDEQKLAPLRQREAEMALQSRQAEFDRIGQTQQARRQLETMLMQRDPSGQLLMRFQLDPQGVAAQIWPAKKPPIKVSAGETLVDPDTLQPQYSSPPKQTESDIARLMRERDELPPGDIRRQLYDAAIQKATTHQPGTNVYTGTMVPAEVGGKPAFVMPGKDGTATVVPGVSPKGTAAETEKEKTRRDAAINRADLLIGKVQDALGKVGFLTTGLTGSVVGSVPGTKAYDLRRDIDTIRANIGFQELQQMRDMSPTGGALGQVAVQELNMLQAVISSLDANQSEDQIRKGLMAIDKHFRNWRDAVTQAGQQSQAPSTPPAPSQAGARVVTRADIEATMRSSGRTRSEIEAAIRAKGWRVEGDRPGASGGF